MLSPTAPTLVTEEISGSNTPTPPKLVTLHINGIEHTIAVEARRTLLDALRHDLHLTGTKKVCDMGDCGACTIILDGRAVYSCLLLAVDCQGYAITTIEALTMAAASNGNASEVLQSEAAHTETLDPLQQAFIEADAFQCGFCTSGQIMSLKALLAATPSPTDEQILRAVTGNLCRCGAYRNIVRAGRMAADAQTVQSSPSSPAAGA